MSSAIQRHIAAANPVINELRANLHPMPTDQVKLYLALFYALRIGVATRDINDLSPGEMIRLCHELAEQIAEVLQAPANTCPAM